MFSDFLLYHYDGGDYHEVTPASSWMAFNTCMRSILMGTVLKGQLEPHRPRNYFVYRGERAYEFLMEVICGMKSPLFGETEVLGQFRELVLRSSEEASPELLEILKGALADAKKIRQVHLQKVGSHSYGSLLRKKMGSSPQKVHILGAGHLVQEILPWFKKQPFDISIFTRSPERHLQLDQDNPQIQLKEYSQCVGLSCDVLIIAAPLSSDQIKKMKFNEEHLEVYDLRGTSESDVLDFNNLMKLQQLMNEIEVNRNKVVQIKKDVRFAIGENAKRRSQSEKLRPFGWDDLWAM